LWNARRNYAKPIRRLVEDMALPSNLITNRTARLPGDLRLPDLKPRKKRKRRSRKEHAARFAATPPLVQTADERTAQRAMFERHDQAVVSIRLPLAPSHNHYWQTWVPPGSQRALTHVSTEGQAFQKAVAWFWSRHYGGFPPEPLTGRIRLLLVVHMPRSARSDISNRLKPLEDALTAAGVWLDDSQVDDERLLRGDVIPGTGAMDVTIESIGQ